VTIKRKASLAEKALRDVQRLMRTPQPPDARFAAHREVPEELAAGMQLNLNREQDSALLRAQEALLSDPAFEHLANQAADRVWYLACQSGLDKKTDFVGPFVAEHFKEPESRNVFVTVEHLKVSAPHAFLGVRFLPVDSPEIPGRPGPARLLIDPQVGSVAVVEVSGTDRERMGERARARVAHVLRLLRIALREHRSINDRQLRFRLGRSHSAVDFMSARTHPEAGWELELRDELIDLANQVEVTQLPFQPVTDVEQKADLATRWMERAWLTGEPLVALLFLFFALEALLGKKSDTHKGEHLAFRQTMLSHIVIGGFTNPNTTFLLYEDVRSAAVHGEKAPPITWSLVQSFALTVRWALSHYLRFARERGFTKRGQILQALEEHPERLQLIAWLRERGVEWTKYFDDAADTSDSG
jgi:hypothetical protein